LENNMAQVRSWFLVAAGACTALVAGCGSGLAPVKGVVTLDGKPLPNASVVFISQESGGRDASGFTDARGVFQLTTYRPGDGALPGALPGRYKVTVHYSEPGQVPANLKTAQAVQKAATQAAAAHKASVVIPAMYTRPDKTTLQQKVPVDGDVKLELKSAKG
jgi:hypothetical protein